MAVNVRIDRAAYADLKLPVPRSALKPTCAKQVHSCADTGAQLTTIPFSLVAEILRFYSKCFFQGAVRLRVYTMCTSIGGTPPHLSSYFSGKGLTFVHFLYL